MLAVGTVLREKGFLAPEVLAFDLQKGLVLSQNLDEETIVSEGAPVPARYRAAVDVLAAMHTQSWPREVALGSGELYRFQDYSHSILINEASLFLEWYVPEKSGCAASDDVRRSFEMLWGEAFDRISGAQIGWVLRDFHSPNLLWQHEARGTDRIGLIDFQDTVIGPVAYDVASLLLDARTDISVELEKELFDAYVNSRQEHNSEFDREAFSDAYAVMAAQRISKILGIFVRLARRDNKPVYLDHLPRMEAYLDRVLEMPVLSDLKSWYADYRS